MLGLYGTFLVRVLRTRTPGLAGRPWYRRLVTLWRELIVPVVILTRLLGLDEAALFEPDAQKESADDDVGRTHRRSPVCPLRTQGQPFTGVQVAGSDQTRGTKMTESDLQCRSGRRGHQQSAAAQVGLGRLDLDGLEQVYSVPIRVPDEQRDGALMR